MGSLSEEAKLFQSRFSHKTKQTSLSRVALTAAVWYIWKERNERVLQLKERQKIIVFMNLYEDIRILLSTCQWKVDRNKLDILSN